MVRVLPRMVQMTLGLEAGALEEGGAAVRGTCRPADGRCRCTANAVPVGPARLERQQPTQRACMKTGSTRYAHAHLSPTHAGVSRCSGPTDGWVAYPEVMVTLCSHLLSRILILSAPLHSFLSSFNFRRCWQIAGMVESFFLNPPSPFIAQRLRESSDEFGYVPLVVLRNLVEAHLPGSHAPELVALTRALLRSSMFCFSKVGSSRVKVGLDQSRTATA